MEFEIVGYSKDYYIMNDHTGNKFVGSVRLDKPDRKQFGYEGRKFQTLTKDKVLDNKKRIKKGTRVWTMIVELNGKITKW